MENSNQRSININVLSSIPAVTQRVHEKFLDYSRELCDLDMDYLNVSITKVGDDGIEMEEDETLEGEYANENTLVVVHKAIAETLIGLTHNHGRLASDIIANLQNAGILFRQRR